MALNKLIILLLLIPFSSQAKLREIKVKQDIKNIRFISKDGKYTYFQKRSGELILSTNYENKVIHKTTPNALMNLTSSKEGKLLILTINTEPHDHLDFEKNDEIYTLYYNGDQLNKEAEGVAPNLHLNDSWLSYYQPRERKIHFKSLTSKQKFEVQLTMDQGSFLRPKVHMLTPDTIIYTDINISGFWTLIQFNRLKKKFNPIYQPSTAGSKVEFCKIGEEYYLGTFPLADNEAKSKIGKLDIGTKKVDWLYRSSKYDLGKMQCDSSSKSIYFVQAVQQTSTELHSVKTEVAELNIKTKEIKVLSQLNDIFHLFKMDGNILTMHRGKYYLIKGQIGKNNDKL